MNLERTLREVRDIRDSAPEPTTADGRRLRDMIRQLIWSGNDDKRLAAIFPHDHESIDAAAARLKLEGKWP